MNNYYEQMKKLLRLEKTKSEIKKELKDSIANGRKKENTDISK